MADFIERYQTLLAAFIAIGGSVYATHPVWKQVGLQQRQLNHQARERLAAKFRMIADVITLLDSEKWRADVPFGYGPPSTANGVDDGVVRKLIAALGTRLDRWVAIKAVIRKALAQAELDLIRPQFDLVDQAFIDAQRKVELLEAHISDVPGFIIRDLNVWMDLIQSTDSVMFFQMAAARDLLAGPQAGVVADLVGPNPV